MLSNIGVGWRTYLEYFHLATQPGEFMWLYTSQREESMVGELFYKEKGCGVLEAQ